MLALSKPVIFYDYTGFPIDILDYGSEVLACTFKDLKLKLSSFLEDSKKYNQGLDTIRKKYYSVSKIAPKQKLDKKMLEIYYDSVKGSL